MTEWAIIIVGLAAIVAMWDAARRRIEADRANRAVHDDIQKLERELEKLSATTQAVLSKLNATQVAQAQRMPRIGRT